MGATGAAEPWLWFVGQAAVRATLWLALTLVAAWALRRAAAAARRWIWVVAIGGALLLPLAGLAGPIKLGVLPPARFTPLAPPWWLEDAHLAPSARDEGRLQAVPLQLPPPRAVGPASTMAAAPARPASWLSQSLLGLYVTGALLALLRLGRARMRAARLLVHARPASDAWPAPPGIDVRQSDQIDLPITIGSLRPVVLVPTAGGAWAPAWRAAVLAHESAHVRSRDPLWQLLAELACVLYWFHPLMYLAARQLRVERELAADDAALGTGMRASEYARLLYELACVPTSTPSAGAVVPLLTPAGLKARLLSVLDAACARRVPRLALTALLGLGLLTFVPLALALPVPRPPVSPALVRPGEIMGRVIDQSDRQPVTNAEVVFRFRDFTLRTSVVTTDQQGWFRYPRDEQPQTDFGVYARKGNRAARKNVLPIPYGTSLPISLDLGPAHTLSGTVRAPDGSPIADATVSVLDDLGMTAPPPGRQVLARTDAQGRWRIEGVMYGEFRLLVEAPWGVATTTLALVDDQDVAALDVVLDRDWAVTGRLQDRAGQPLPGVRIEHGTMRFFTSSKTGWQMHTRPGQRYLDWDQTAADGSFRLLQRGRTITVWAARGDGPPLYAQFEDGGARRAFRGQLRQWELVPGSTSVTVTMTATAQISGVVLDQHNVPVAGTTVRAQPARLGPMESPTATTDGNGRFTLTGVPPTNVFVTAPHAPNFHADLNQSTRLLPHPGEHIKDLQLRLTTPPPPP